MTDPATHLESERDGWTPLTLQHRADTHLESERDGWTPLTVQNRAGRWAGGRASSWRSVAAATVAGVMAAAVLAGCSPGDGGGPQGRAAADGAEVGGTLRVAIGRPGSVDPLDAYEPDGLLVAATMCDTLVELDPRTGELAPGLAESWTVLDEGTRISFRLRRSARFSDGRRIRPEDVVASLTRAASPAFAGRAAPLLSGIAGFDDLQREVQAVDSRRRLRLSGVRSLSQDTVQVSFAEPSADAVRLFTHPVTSPVSRRSIEDDPAAAARQPVCSGPYRLVEPWSPGASTFTLERVPGFEGRSTTASRGGAGYVERIEVQVAAAGAVPEGVDVVAGTAVGPAPPPGLERRTGPSPAVEYLALPHGPSSPFGELGLRRAVDLALDRSRLAEVAGAAVAPATSFLPPTLPATARPDPCGADRLRPTADPAGARALLDAAGADPAALSLRLATNDDGTNRAVVEEMATQLRANLGATVEVTVTPFEELLAAATTGTGLEGPVRVSWAAPYPSADAHLAPLFLGSATTAANLGRWDDPVWDRLLVEEARESGDDGDRVLLHRRLEDRLCELLPSLPLVRALARADVAARVGSALPGGTPLDPLTGRVALRELHLRP